MSVWVYSKLWASKQPATAFIGGGCPVFRVHAPEHVEASVNRRLVCQTLPRKLTLTSFLIPLSWTSLFVSDTYPGEGTSLLCMTENTSMKHAVLSLNTWKTLAPNSLRSNSGAVRRQARGKFLAAAQAAGAELVALPVTEDEQGKCATHREVQRSDEVVWMVGGSLGWTMRRSDVVFLNQF